MTPLVGGAGDGKLTCTSQKRPGPCRRGRGSGRPAEQLSQLYENRLQGLEYQRIEEQADVLRLTMQLANQMSLRGGMGGGVPPAPEVGQMQHGPTHADRMLDDIVKREVEQRIATIAAGQGMPRAGE